MRHKLAISGLSTLAMLAVLLFLGTWQVQRLAWKQAIIAALEAAERRPPVVLGAQTPAPFARVEVQGVFAPGKVAAYGSETRSIRGATVGGARLLAVLDREDGAAVLVDRGWIPDALANSLPTIAASPAVIEGYVRPAESGGMFTPAPNLAMRRFYALDPVVIGRALGVGELAPFVLVEMGPTGIPDPVRSLPRPVNNHLIYALTWYGLAVVLVVIFVIYLRKVLRP